MMLTMRSADLAGHVLAGRYRLITPLGAGAGGRAYVAEDRHLGRRVAVKVLHRDLAGDQRFLARFRAEARVVASLSHPNIVTLHDWGEDPVPFMVFELLEGGSLAGLMASGMRMTPAQATELGRQVVAGLGHAHERGLVHRDVKPGNLLLDARGAVKIADFGLARALAEANTTEPSGALVGTARYAAPEQVTGEALDARADLYSLALILVEAVTGIVPLVGETPVATLVLRASRPVEAPPELGSLGVVVERAGLPLPVERYRDAAAMGNALEAAAGMLPGPEPITVPGLATEVEEPAPTEMSTRAAAGHTAVAAETAAPKDPAEPGRESQAVRRWIPAVVALAAALALASGAWAATAARAPTVHAPNLVGQFEDEAGSGLGGRGLSLDVTDRVYAPDPPGTVISQSPAGGGSLRRGSEVRVVVSLGAEPVSLPDVAGQPAPDAEAALRAAGFEVGIEERFDDAVPSGTVVLQEPTGRQAPGGSAITVVVSKGKRPVLVPNVVGQTLDEARAELEEARFAVGTAEEYSDAVAKGKVIRQDPVSGAEIVPGTEVTVVVSKGPNRVLIPDVRGLTVEAATEKIEAAGLEVDVVGYKPGAKVKSQDPEGGLMLERGRTVTLFA